MRAATASPGTVAGPVTQVRVARSEWRKLRALRSNWYCVLAAVVLVVGLGAVIAAVVKPHDVSAAHPAAGAVSLSLSGITLAQLAFGVLGVLLFSGEYGTGMIRVSLTAVPSRSPVLWAKLAALVGLVLPVALLSAMADFFAATAIRSAKGVAPIALTDPGVLRTVVGSSLYLTVAAVAGLALGALLRNTAAGLSVFTAAFFVAPLVVVFLPPAVTSAFAPYLPSNAGGAVWGQTFVEHPLSPWAGFAVVCVYATVLVGLAAWRLRRSDA
jgi:ABC-type transport system involved in multi-copper enzyme maturation permease subunit